jgi:ubiquinone/menaquinone biosynthesis C-methylase UbiE
MSKNDDPFYEYYARESESESTLQRFSRTKSVIERAARYVALAPGPWRVADIGCGAATQCMLWAADGHLVQGVDINERLIELGRSRASESGVSVNLSVGSAVDLPWPDDSVDICLCPELLEHVSDWQKCLDEVRRILKPGGLFFVTTTNKLCPRQQEFYLPLYSWYPTRLKRHFEHLAVTTKPELVNHAKYPAVNWFSYTSLAGFLVKRGFRCFDRFDIAALGPHSVPARLALSVVRSTRLTRWLGQVMTPRTVVLAQKLRSVSGL